MKKSLFNFQIFICALVWTLRSVPLQGKNFISPKSLDVAQNVAIDRPIRPDNPLARLLDETGNDADDEGERRPLLRRINRRPRRFMLAQEQPRLLVTLYLRACVCER